MSIENRVVVAKAAVVEAMTKGRWLVEEAEGVAKTDNWAYGEVVPTPKPVPVVAPVKKDRLRSLVRMEPL